MNCPYCDNEIVHEDATFCPKCGKSLTAEDETQQATIEVPQKRTDLVLAAAILTMVSAAFVAGIGFIGVYQYDTLVSYYGSSMASEFLGFLIFGVVGIIAAAFGLVGGMFMLKRKRFTISMLGAIFPLISVLVTFISVQQYGYSFTDLVLFTEITIAMLSLMSIMLSFPSKTEYS